MKMRSSNLLEAFKKIFVELNESILKKIVKLLNYYLQNDSISYENIRELIKQNPTDPLLFLCEKKMFISQRSSHGTLEWGDSTLEPNPQGTYRMPQITESLLRTVQKKRVWNVDEVIKRRFKHIEEPKYQKMPRLVRQLYQASQNQMIDGAQIRHMCERMGIEERIDSIISELKGLGIMSPTITQSLFSAVRSKAPQYELNPLLFKIYNN